MDENKKNRKKNFLKLENKKSLNIIKYKKIKKKLE